MEATSHQELIDHRMTVQVLFVIGPSANVLACFLHAFVILCAILAVRVSAGKFEVLILGMIRARLVTDLV